MTHINSATRRKRMIGNKMKSYTMMPGGIEVWWLDCFGVRWCCIIGLPLLPDQKR